MDIEFLKQLDENKRREVYVRIIALTFQETPVEQIEGLATGGSINIDGSSALRRTCSINLVAQNVEINDFHWGLKSKFKLEVGLKNTVDTEKYPDIIWFPQGTYVINKFSTSRQTNNYTISISGQDKMCLLNGSLGGNIPASVDFGVEEYYDKVNNITTYTKIPIEKIVREALHAYALEPYHNIVINDLDEAAVELLEYRGANPLYLLRNVETDEFVNYTEDGSLKVRFNDKLISIDSLEDEENGGTYDKRVELATDVQAAIPSEVTFEKDQLNTTYTVAKIEYGQTVGYRNTELVYAGDLISSVGETLVSVLDKIKNMLGNYEYFYDVDGRFIFQRKKSYSQKAWGNMTQAGQDEYQESPAQTSAVTYRFENNNLITSFQNSPNLANLKNDYSVWGERESAAGAQIPIHYRYAIDYKPTVYTTLNITEEDVADHNAVYGETAGLKPQESKTYTSDEYDWRELIYQMALDYFKYNQLDCYAIRLAEANKNNGEDEPLYQHGMTGYEQYYTDLQGFWRQLYDSDPQPNYFDYYYATDEDSFKYVNSEGEIKPLYIKNIYKKTTLQDKELSEIKTIKKVNDHYELQSLLDAIEIPEYIDQTYYDKIEDIGDDEIAEEYESQIFYIRNNDETYSKVLWSVHKQYDKDELYVYDEVNEIYLSIIDSSYNVYNDHLYYYDEDGEFYNILEIEDELLQSIYIISIEK